MNVKTVLGVVLLALASVGGQVVAQSAAEVIEQARAEAREFNEYKVALEDPDQSVRLALFEAMLGLQNPPLRMMAIETGISSTDNIMRSRALLAQVLSMEQLHLQVEVNPNAPSKVQQSTRASIDQSGGTVVLGLSKKEKEAGTFRAGSFNGQITNLRMQFLESGPYPSKIDLTLQDDNTLKGLYVNHKGDYNALVTLKIF